ncbi:MAG: DUF2905 family protein [candidate division WOR-3 bacterium]
MGNLSVLGRLLILLGGIFLFLGLLLLFISRLGAPRLPGDILIQRPNLVIYIPIVSMLVISILLTLILNLLFRRWR